MKFWNHYRTANIESSSILYPKTEEELIGLIRQAGQEKRKFRVMGACHSQMGIMFGEEINVSVSRYNGVIKVEDKLVTIQAGITLTELDILLAEHDLSLSNMTSSGHPTFVGAMLTGSHGGSTRYGGMASMVTAMRLIKWDGSVLDIQRGDPLFDAAAVSFGSLGVISTVTIECLRGHRFATLRQPMRFEDFIQQWESLSRSNDYIRCLWYPITDDMEIWTANRVASEGKEKIKTDKSVNASLHRISKLDQILAPIAIFIVSYFRSLQLMLTREFIRKDTMAFEGTANEAFCMDDGGNPQFFEAGVAVPYQDTIKVLQKMREYFRAKNHYPIFPIEFRPAPADKFWMSSAYEREITAFALLAHRNGRCDAQPFYREMAEFLTQFDYRIHWGMQIIKERTYLSRQYPHWQDFIKLKKEMDPHNIFSHPIFDYFFAGAATTHSWQFKSLSGYAIHPVVFDIDTVASCPV
jgi:FAD/FMN-containing dehydrogenase